MQVTSFFRQNLNNILLAITVMLIVIQIVTVLNLILSLIVPSHDLLKQIIPEKAALVRSNWNIFLYVVFVILNCIFYIFCLARINVNKAVNTGDLLRFMSIEAMITFGIISALYKAMIYDHSPILANGVLIVFVFLAVIHKLFYREIWACIKWLKTKTVGFKVNSWIWDVVLIAGIMMMIYIPNCERVLAMVFMGDALHHFDFLIMAPGWAALHGHLPYVGIISQYGVGLPIILSKLISIVGSFEYLTAFLVMMGVVIIYFILVYVFMRSWLVSVALALTAFLLIFRLQMFHYGVSPLIWGVPSASPIRFGFDIIWMMTLLAHIRYARRRWLILSALYSGFAVFYMTSTGACIMIAFYAYMMALIFFKDLRREWINDQRQVIIYIVSLVLPVVSAVILFWLVLGQAAWSKEFWHNLIEYLYFFAHGHAGGVLPMFESLKYRHYWAFIMSIVLPLTYVVSLLYIVGNLYIKKAPKEWILVAVLSVYGLAGYQYYVVRSAVTSYYVAVVPFVFICLFWFKLWMDCLSPIWQRRLKFIAVAVSLYALTTNQNYLAYPNIFNFSRNPMVDNMVIQRWPDRQGYFNHQFKSTTEVDKLPYNDLGNAHDELLVEDNFKTDAQLLDYYHEHFDFSVDAALIDGLTLPNERVALLSSFETKILIQAKRASLFYHSPLITSRPMHLRTYPSDAAHSPLFLQQTLDEFKEHRPSHVFMEKVFMQDNIPSSYQNNRPTITTIAAYIRAHYEPIRYGKYLVAMRLKE